LGDILGQNLGHWTVEVGNWNLGALYCVLASMLLICAIFNMIFLINHPKDKGLDMVLDNKVDYNTNLTVKEV